MSVDCHHVECTNRYECQYAWRAQIAWGNFHKAVFYGSARWPSYCEWIVPGSITNMERI